MTQSVLMIAFILFCLNNVNGQKMYEKDPGFLASLGEEQFPLNWREYLNDKYIETPSISLDYNNHMLPIWIASNKKQDDSLDDQRSKLFENYGLDKRYQLIEPIRKRAQGWYGYGKRSYFTNQRQRRNGKRGQLYLNHLARMNKK